MSKKRTIKKLQEDAEPPRGNIPATRQSRTKSESTDSHTALPEQTQKTTRKEFTENHYHSA